MLFPNLKLPSSLEEYSKIERLLKSKDEALVWNVYWVLARADLWFLLKYVLSTREWLAKLEGIRNESWLFDRCRDVQSNSDRIMDIWARFHWKSNIKTFANTIRYLLIDPNYTFGILSHTRPIAKAFLDQIRREILANEILSTTSWHPETEKHTFPTSEKLYKKNSLDEGIIVPSRSSNPKEASISAWGLVDSLPTSAHFKIRNYDDTVTDKSVATADMNSKTTKAYEQSLNLGMPYDEAWVTGTFYAHDCTYHTMLKRGMPLRVQPCYELDESNCQLDLKTGSYSRMAWHMDRPPVLYEEEHLQRLFKEAGAEEGSRTALMQMLCDANAGLNAGFDVEWIQYYHTDPMAERSGKNVYILVDPANEKKKHSDYTVMAVVAVGSDRNYYLLDLVRDRLSLHERAETLFELNRVWEPLEVRYERYGLQADTGFIEYLQDQRGYRFPIYEVGGIVRKQDRIERLLPLFRSGKFFLPVEIEYTDHSGERRDLVDYFVNEEYLTFPNSTKVDVLDAISRIAEPDMPVLFPDDRGGKSKMRYAVRRETYEEVSWMGA